MPAIVPASFLLTSKILHMRKLLQCYLPVFCYNNKLFMFTDEFTEDGAYSKLEGNRSNYFLVSSWAGGTKLNTLRYYYKMNDAKKYLGINTSNGLAEVLQDGEFEDLSWN